VDVEDLPSLIGEDRFMILWGCAFEDMLTRKFDDGSNVVDDYLKRRGWKETAPNRAYMDALRDSVMSLYEVSGIVPGESFLARDLVRGGEPVRVTERSGSRSLKQWDRIGARVVCLGGKTVIGGGLLLFKYDSATTVLDIITRTRNLSREDAEQLAGVAGLDVPAVAFATTADPTEVLGVAAPLFSSIWLGEALKAELDPEPISAENSEGEKIEYTFLRYKLRPGVPASRVREALAALPALRAASDSFWNWLSDGAPGRQNEPRRGKKGLRFVTTNETGAVVLGGVELEKGAVTLSVNSRGRAERGRVLIESALGDLVGPPDIETETLEQALERGHDAKPRSASSPFSPEETRAIVQETIDQYYEKALDEPIPMLGGATPRQTAETPAGRAKIVEWLKLLENQAAAHPPGDPMHGYDSTWLWERLGVADLRR
jgi:hypothetical protein